MGREIRCMAELRDWTGDGRLLLETDALIFRGAKKLTIPRAEITSVRDDNGWLVVEDGDDVDRFDLGKLTPSWVNAILNPRSRIDKLDVKDVSRIALVGDFDDDFIDELRARTTNIDNVESDTDLIFVRIEDAAQLDQLPSLRQRMTQNGGIWLIHPKGDASLSHGVIVGAAKAAGLIDNKTARFSETHTALKLVIPKANRSKAT
jgi:hypothetical protein